MPSVSIGRAFVRLSLPGNEYIARVLQRASLSSRIQRARARLVVAAELSYEYNR